MGDDQHAFAGAQVRDDRVVPVRQQPRRDVAKRLAARGRHGVGAPPELDLLLAVLPGHLVLVSSPQRAVVAPVEPPRAPDGDPRRDRRPPGRTRCCESPGAAATCAPGRAAAPQRPAAARRGRTPAPGLVQIRVGPAGEQVPGVPFALYQPCRISTSEPFTRISRRPAARPGRAGSCPPGTRGWHRHRWKRARTRHRGSRACARLRRCRRRRRR